MGFWSCIVGRWFLKHSGKTCMDDDHFHVKVKTQWCKCSLSWDEQFLFLCFFIPWFGNESLFAWQKAAFSLTVTQWLFIHIITHWLPSSQHRERERESDDWLGNGRLEHFSVDVNDPLFVVVEMSSPHGDRASLCNALSVCSSLTLYTFSATILHLTICSCFQGLKREFIYSMNENAVIIDSPSRLFKDVGNQAVCGFIIDFHCIDKKQAYIFSFIF